MTSFFTICFFLLCFSQAAAPPHTYPTTKHTLVQHAADVSTFSRNDGPKTRKTARRETPLLDRIKTVDYPDMDIHFSEGRLTGGATFGGLLVKKSDEEKMAYTSQKRRVGTDEWGSVYVKKDQLVGYSDVPCGSGPLCKNACRNMNVFNPHKFCAYCLLRLVECDPDFHNPKECDLCVKRIDDIARCRPNHHLYKRKELKGDELKKTLGLGQMAHFDRAKYELKMYYSLGGDRKTAPPCGFKYRKKAVLMRDIPNMTKEEKNRAFVKCITETGPHDSAKVKNYSTKGVEDMAKHFGTEYVPEGKGGEGCQPEYNPTPIGLKRKRSSNRKSETSESKSVKSREWVEVSDEEDDGDVIDPKKDVAPTHVVTVWQVFEKLLVDGQKDMAQMLVGTLEEMDVPQRLRLLWGQVKEFVKEGQLNQANTLVNMCK